MLHLQFRNILNKDMKLIKLKPGEKAIAFGCEKNDLPLKLMEMGCLDGTEIIFLKRAPLGSPFYYKIGDTRIAIDKELARKIDVKLLNDEQEKN